MTAFFAAAGALLATMLILLLPTLMRRDGRPAMAGPGALSLQVLREQFAELERDRSADAKALAEERAELERRTMEDAAHDIAAATFGGRKPWHALGVALLVPLLAGALYWKLGNPAAMGTAAQGSHALGPQQIQAMTERLAERLQQNPADGEGWAMLGRSYTALGRHAEAAAAFGRAAAILAPNATLLADYADVLAMAQGRRLSGDPEKIALRALQADPNHVKSLALAGSAAFERRDYPQAIAYWRKILTLVPPGSGVARSITNSIADAETRMAAAPAAPGTATAVSGLVSLAPGAGGSTLKPDDVVYVFARDADGARMPLAMTRLRAGDLPARFLLDDSMAASPGARISTAREIVVGARLSRSGDPLPRSGDVEGFSASVAPGSRNVNVVIASPVR